MANGMWAFRDPETGVGIPAMLWADTLLPWSSPVPIGSASTPAGWSANVPPGMEDPSRPGYYRQGQFQREWDKWGWERNMLNWRSAGNVSVGQPNFPAGCGYRIVMVNPLGLRDSATAPPRVFESRPKGEDTTQWPFTASGMWTEFLDLYRATYMNNAAAADERCYMIPIMAERELRKIFDPSTGTDPAEGMASVRGVIRHLLTTRPWQILAWHLADEPDFALSRAEKISSDPDVYRPDYYHPDALRRLRDFVRECEYDYRVETDAAFRALTIPQREALLRPCTISLSGNIVRANETIPEALVAAVRVWRQCADIVFFDEYPYKLTRIAAKTDADAEGVTGYLVAYDRLAALPNDEGAFTTQEQVVRSLTAFVKVRDALNIDDCGNSIGVNAPEGYKPVVNWVQATGGITFPWLRRDKPDPEPRRTYAPMAAATKPSPLWESSIAPPVIENRDIDGTPTPFASPTRLRRIPNDLQLRFYSWSSFLLWSEGMACFRLPTTPSNRLFEDAIPGLTPPYAGAPASYYTAFANVAKELLYFANFRVNWLSGDPSVIITNRVGRYWPGEVIEGEPTPPMVFLANYANPPTGVAEIWLFALNPNDRELQFTLTPQTGFLQGRRFQEWLFGRPLVAQDTGWFWNQHNSTFGEGTTTFKLSKFRFRLWKLVST